MLYGSGVQRLGEPRGEQPASWYSGRGRTACRGSRVKEGKGGGGGPRKQAGFVVASHLMPCLYPYACSSSTLELLHAASLALCPYATNGHNLAVLASLPLPTMCGPVAVQRRRASVPRFDHFRTSTTWQLAPSTPRRWEWTPYTASVNPGKAFYQDSLQGQGAGLACVIQACARICTRM
jgi:hypothetical protein